MPLQLALQTLRLSRPSLLAIDAPSIGKSFWYHPGIPAQSLLNVFMPEFLEKPITISRLRDLSATYT
jgi:hypothetical protein